MRPQYLHFVCSWAVASIVLCQVCAADDTVDYVRDIKPILSNSCYTCHGPDEEARKADLRLDDREVAITHAIVPGDAAASELIARVTSDDPDAHMPPSSSRRLKLTSDQVSLLRKWIDQGANFQKHWAYEPVRRPAVPQVSDEHVAAISNPIDNFVVARLEREGLRPSPRADARTQIRRLSFDIVGLPPEPETVKDYSKQIGASSSYRKLVNQLLSKPAFGERLTAYWLDVVRYGDSVGIHGDQLVSMSPYRDYVLKAFNENMPYDQFVTEQLAGDLLPDATTDQKVASAFNRMHMITAEGGAQPKEYLAIYAADRVRNTSAALLGTTLGCAQCHDHKFDPFSAKEFYEFASFFSDLKETGVYGGSNWFPKLQVPEPGQAEELAQLVEQMKAAEAEVPQEAEKEDPKLKAFEEAKRKKEDFEKTIPTVLVSLAVEPREMRLLPRGNWLDESGPVVQPGFPKTLGIDAMAPEDGERLGRRELARWMTHPDNPLVARVFVNRLWKLMMGEGIVTSLDDFGSQGSVPSHPQLLDWLAVEFIESGWDIKHMVRLIVSSHTYRQSSATSDELKKRDPENRLLARQNRFRLDAEAIRDNALAVSGLLVKKVGGKSVRPYQPAGYYAHLNFPRRKYQASQGDDLYRRSVYTHWQRTFVHPSLMAFDAPSREECTVNRPRSNTPLQSLVLFNDPIYVEAGRKLAERVLLSSNSTEERLSRAFDFVLQRQPTEKEKEVLLALVKQHLDRYQQKPELAVEVAKNGEAKVAAGVDAQELAAWTSVSRVLLSLHETITRS